MKIKCSYCGTYFDDYLTKCPSCGAASEGVKRTVSNQPQTIEELAQWYKDRGLPPYKTTRFFIGENYKGARAFGIYKDEKTGNFVVYKNKDNGQRAVRYEGTDEPYAVNELFQRLKQEIIEQKKHSAQKKGGGGNGSNSPRKVSGSYGSHDLYKSNMNKKPSLLDRYAGLGCLPAGLILIAAFFVGIVLLGSVIMLGQKILDHPELGYYKYNGEYMYYSNWVDDIEDDGWITYHPDTDRWTGVAPRTSAPKALHKFKTASRYYLGREWSASYGCPDFLKSEDYVTISGNKQVSIGYYKHNNKFYYHSVMGRDSGWYSYDSGGWEPLASEDIPEDIYQYHRAEDFWYTPEWNSETQLSDFTESEYYVPPSTSSDSKDDSFWDSWDNYDNDSDYDWDYSYDSWDSYDTDWDSDW